MSRCLMAARGLSSERIARDVLERMGFKVVSTRQRITAKGVEVGEVDLVAEAPSGDRFSVEVKAGRASVSDVRQAFSNAKLLGLKPMLICKGFSDSAAEAVAKELGVEVLELPQFYMLLEAEELESIVRRAVADALESLERPRLAKLSKREIKALEVLASSSSWEEASSRFRGRVKLEDVVASLRSKGVLSPRHGFKALSCEASRILPLLLIEERLRRLEKAVRKLARLLINQGRAGSR